MQFIWRTQMQDHSINYLTLFMDSLGFAHICWLSFLIAILHWILILSIPFKWLLSKYMQNGHCTPDSYQIDTELGGQSYYPNYIILIKYNTQNSSYIQRKRVASFEWNIVTTIKNLIAYGQQTTPIQLEFNWWWWYVKEALCIYI